MKTVIFNADDFGASVATNAAILRAHREGLLTSASLMVNEKGAEEAFDLAGDNPSLDVGLHLVMSDGRAALGHADAPGLVRPDGRFPADPAIAGLRAFFLPAARRQIQREVAAQFSRFVETGLTPTHVDGHQHLHLHPVIWDALVSQCLCHEVRWVRIPFEEFRPASKGRMAGRRAEWLFFRALRLRCSRSLQRAGLCAADRVYGHLETGRMTEEYVLGLLPRLRGTANEVYFHPGTPHAAPLPGDPSCMDVELHALLSARVRDEVERMGIRLASYASLQADPAGLPLRVE